ncbi:MAG: class I SAM-dependent methyltransferase, partial [Actinomycetota bacterium]
MADQRPYRGTAEAYERFRRPYPPALISALAEAVPLGRASTVADLACGTGQVARALMPRVAATTAIDIEPDFIELARALEPAIEWRVGESDVLGIP